MAIAIALFVFLMMAMGGLYIFVKEELTRESIEKVTEIGNVLKAALKKQMVAHDAELLNTLVAEIMAYKKISGISIINADGVVKFSSDPAFIGEKIFKDSEGCHHDAAGRNSLTRQTRNSHGASILRNVTHIYNEAPCFQCHPARQKNLGLLLVDYSTAGTDALISSTLSRLFLTTLIAFIIISLVIFYIANRLIYKPITLLMDGARELKNGNFGKQIHYGENTEFKILADSFNDMSEKLRIGRDHLEDCIAERTSELEISNERLVREIVERSKALEALHESEENNRLLLQAAGDGILGVNSTGKVTFVNPAALRMLGFAEEEMLGQRLHPLIHHSHEDGSSYPMEECPMCASYTYATASTMISSFLWRKDGHAFPVECSSMPIITRDGKITGAVVIFKDLTERKQAEAEKRLLEERLQHADKMEAIGTLAGGIAHDFNNLLMGIQGYASLSLMNIDSSHPNYEKLKQIEEQVQRGADLTKQLLGFARGGRYEIRPTDMNEILEKSSSMFGRTKKEVSICRKYDKNLWPVEVDRGQMEQVFLNLYVNAWQAMPGGGEIYIETRNVLSDYAPLVSCAVSPGKYVKIAVTDTGTGMDEKTRERIFDPFFTTKAMGRGTGLGLAMVYGIIKGHKGVITVDSEPGRGTTFNIYLPASEQEVVTAKTTTGTVARGTETILLVDDEKMILGVNKELLECMGYRVYTAGSGQEAIAVYMEKQKEINLVILDMIMPGISGSGTFDRLRELNPALKVLLASGYSISGEARTIMDRGCSGFLQKPFRLEILSRTVREMLD